VTARLSELRAEINSLKAEKNTLNATLAEKKSELASVKEELGKMSPRTELEEAVAAANSNYTDKNNACELAKFNLNTKKKELDSFSDSGFEFFLLQAYIDDYADKIEEATELKEDFEKQLSKAEMIIKEVQSEITKTPEECENDKLKLTRTIEDAEEAIRIAEANGAIKNETAAMNLEIKKREIERKKKEIQDLKNATAETEIKAPVSGTISSVGIASGSDVDADTVAFEIIMTDMGYTMECSVTNSQAARLRIGQEATVQYYYWGNKPSVRISQITTDPNSGGKNKLVTFAVEGDVSAGTSLSLVIGTEGQSYDTIVPNSAIREDSNGKFVLKVVSKSSPLGNRYFAERLDVEVLASDATKSAINASLSWGDYVIVGASVPISAGMQVRMAE
nr:HlyD family efflux transporter periplasmic adaptor subunit [Clostridia bacterium]